MWGTRVFICHDGVKSMHEAEMKIYKEKIIYTNYKNIYNLKREDFFYVLKIQKADRFLNYTRNQQISIFACFFENLLTFHKIPLSHFFDRRLTPSFRTAYMLSTDITRVVNTNDDKWRDWNFCFGDIYCWREYGGFMEEKWRIGGERM